MLVVLAVILIAASSVGLQDAVIQNASALKFLPWEEVHPEDTSCYRTPDPRKCYTGSRDTLTNTPSPSEQQHD
jgi:hypothetical protein